jgi:cell wall-associated NlpC family hydrolase
VLAQAAEYRAAFAPAGSGSAQAVLSWAVAHVGRFTYNLGPPTDRGGGVEDMQDREPSGTTCDCSMFVRWAMAQAGVDVGLTTSTQWTANGLLPAGDTPADKPVVARGVGPDAPLGGYQPGDIIFFGVDDGPSGHDALCWATGRSSSVRRAAAGRTSARSPATSPRPAGSDGSSRRVAEHTQLTSAGAPAAMLLAALG